VRHALGPVDVDAEQVAAPEPFSSTSTDPRSRRGPAACSSRIAVTFEMVSSRFMLMQNKKWASAHSLSSTVQSSITKKRSGNGLVNGWVPQFPAAAAAALDSWLRALPVTFSRAVGCGLPIPTRVGRSCRIVAFVDIATGRYMTDAPNLRQACRGVVYGYSRLSPRRAALASIRDLSGASELIRHCERIELARILLERCRGTHF